MKILCTWELGSKPEALLYLSEIVSSIRQSGNEHTIILASNRHVLADEAPWADLVFCSPSIRIQSNLEAPGFWRYFHIAGWTDPSLRGVVFRHWANLLDEIKPDIVISCASPSATLVSILDERKVIQVGSGQYIPDASFAIEQPFPEMADWLYHCTGRTLEGLLDTPKIIFCPQTIDDERYGLCFHGKHPEPDYAQDFKGRAVCIWSPSHRLYQKVLSTGRHLWGHEFVMMSPKEFRQLGYTRASLEEQCPLIISHFDIFSANLAVTNCLPYMGIPINAMQEVTKNRVLDKRLGFLLDDAMNMLKAHKEQPFVMNGLAAQAGAISRSRYSEMQNALNFLLKRL